jgi:CIC family chloride channel protein
VSRRLGSPGDLVLGRSQRTGVLAVLTGAATGLAVALFDRLVARGMVDNVLRAPLWAQAGLPVIGLVVAAVILRIVGRGASPSTADEYIRDFHDSTSRLDVRPAPARLLASAATLGGGAAMGFEGPAIYIGALIGSWAQSRWTSTFSRDDSKLLMVCGAAAGVAAIFKAPATGLVFALEVPYQEDLARRMLLPAMFSAATSYVVYVAINGIQPLFPVGGTPPFDLRDLGGAALLGLLAGVGALGFAHLLRWCKSMAAERSAAVRLPVVGTGIVAVFVATRAVSGRSLSVGSGYEAIAWALEPGHGLLVIGAVFALRLLSTALAVGGGGVGGLFVPLVVQGALLGGVLTALFHSSDPTFFPLLGVAAFLGAGYRVPLAAVVFVAETTGRPGFVVPALLAAAVSQLPMRGTSVSPYQAPTRISTLARRLALPVAVAMRTDAATAPSDATLAELFDHHVIQLRLRVIPIVDGSRYRGLVYLRDFAHMSREEWERTTVGEVVDAEVPTADVSWTLGDAIRAMDEADIERMAVLDGDAYAGLLTTGEVLKLDEILDTTEHKQG